MTDERSTRQRASIRNAIEASPRPLSIDEIRTAAAVRVPGLGIATVYRAVRRLLDEGAIVSVDVAGGAPRFERAGADHHHHFVCYACARVYDVDGCPGDLRRLAPRGFRVEGHEVTLFGRCADCVRAARAPAA